jgi:hypothetical protein
MTTKPLSMRWKSARMMLFSFSLMFSTTIRAQSCSYFPADCPSDRQMVDSADRFGNPVTAEEVSMELRLHEFFTDLMQQQADNKGWEMYQYDETAASGYLNAERSGPLVSNLRPPHEYEISFIFIVNKDSMLAWKAWNKKSTEDLLADMQKMRTNNDFTAISNKQELLRNITERFRNASTIRVKFTMNPADAIVSSITDHIRQTGRPNVPHAVLAIQVHNDKIDENAIFDLNQFTRCSDLAFLLFGNWNLTPDKYQYYRPGYNADKKNIDLVTPKVVPSTKVRTIVVHVEGAPPYINQFLQSLDTEKLYGIITR